MRAGNSPSLSPDSALQPSGLATGCAPPGTPQTQWAGPALPLFCLVCSCVCLGSIQCQFHCSFSFSLSIKPTSLEKYLPSTYVVQNTLLSAE